MSQFNCTLSLEKFKVFYDVLKVVSSYINDVDIKSGKIRQLTPDKVSVILMDLSSIFPHDLSFTDVKTKLSLFELLLNDENNVTIQAVDKFWFTFNDKTVFKHTKSLGKRLDSSYIEDTQFNSKFADNITSDKEVFSIDLVSRPDVHKKIKKVAEIYNSEKILFSVDKKEISLSIESVDKKNNAIIFKEKNSANIEDTEILVRSNFIDKIDTNVIKKITFFKEMLNNDGVSISKATCEVEKLSLDIFTFCKKVKKIGDGNAN